MSASASGFNLAKLPPALRRAEIVVDTADAPAFAEAGKFEEGQLSGPFGPRFVGFGKPPRVPLWRYIAEWAALLFLGSLIVMALL